MVGRERRWTRPPAARLRALALAAVTTVAWPALPAAAEVRVDLFNDFLTDNLIDDDLYTFGFEFGYRTGVWDFALTENAFTDTLHGVRFDETYLAAGREMPVVRGWHSQLRLGLLRVGEGLFGESFQNRLHKLIGDRPVELRYVDDRRIYATAHLTMWRRHDLRPRLDLYPRVDLETAPDFKGSAVFTVETVWHAHRRAWLGVRAGLRYTHVDFAPLVPWVDDLSTVGAVSFGLPRGLVVSWNYNRFGTRVKHVNFLYRWRPQGEPFDREP